MTSVPFSKRDISLTPQMWRRLIRTGLSFQEFWTEFTETVMRDNLIINDVVHSRESWSATVTGYVRAYVMFDVMFRHGFETKLQGAEKYNMAFVFEDLVGSSIRTVISHKWLQMRREAVYVDKLGKPYQGLDYAIFNYKGDWGIGIQCKKYVNLTSRTTSLKAPFHGTNIQHILKSGLNLRKRHPGRRFALFYWYSYRRATLPKSQERMLHKLSDCWDNVICFDEGQPNMGSYTPNLTTFGDFVHSTLWRSKA